jgi:hypothetical protein
MRITERTLPLACSCLLLVAALSIGQASNATASGLIAVGINAVLPAVTVANLNSLLVSTAHSNSGGFYWIAGLLPGKVSTSKDDSKIAVNTNIELHAEV